MSAPIVSAVLLGAVVGWVAGWLSCYISTSDQQPSTLKPVIGPIAPGDVYWLSGRRVEVLSVGAKVRYRSLVHRDLPEGVLAEPLFRDLALLEAAP